MERIKWLDGLRGLAAFIVTFNHFFNGEIRAPYQSFWADPPSSNRHIIQLPPLRLLWAKDAMVSLFMVISGYSISSTLLRTRESSPSRLPAHIRSSVCRRPLRLFLPIMLLSIPSQITYYFDGFAHPFRDKVTRQIQPGVNPWRHVGYMLEFLMDGLNVIAPQWNEGINEQLWTMPLEFRGSCFTYAVIAVQAAWRPATRRCSLVCLMLYMWWYAHWDLICFVGGLFTAEMEIGPEPGSETQAQTPPTASDPNSSLLVPSRTARKILPTVVLATGVYLLCLPSSTEDATFPPGYGALEIASTWHFTEYSGNWTFKARMWESAGSILFFAGILHSPRLHHLLCTRPISLLGRLSFAMYLLHMCVYQLWRAPLRDALWGWATGTEYPGVEVASAERLGLFLGVYVVAGVVLGSVVMATAELYMRYVDGRVVRFTREFDRWVNGGDYEEVPSKSCRE